MPAGEGKLTFRRAARLTLAKDYQRAYKARTSVVRGPLRISSALNGKPHARLGLSVPGKVGTNVKRNRIKRLIREAFRLNQRVMPAGIDLVVGVQPHGERTLEEYSAWLVSGSKELAGVWAARERGGRGS